MDRAAGEGARGAVLIGAALLALVAGGWWWQANAPAIGAVAGTTRAGAGTGPGDGAGPGAGPVRAGAGPEVRVQLDAATGEVLGADGRREVWLDPGLVPGIDRAGGWVFRPPGGDGDPSSGETVWRVDETLAPDTTMTRQAFGDGNRYLLQYRCVRPGALRVRVTGARIGAPARVDCDGGLTTAPVTTGSGPVRVFLSAVGDGPIVVEARLLRLP